MGTSSGYMTPNTGGPIDYSSITHHMPHLFAQFEHSTVDMMRFHKILDRLTSSLSEMDHTLCKARRKYLRKHGLRILQQTKNIQDELLHVINKSKSNSIQASLLVSSMSNLIAQQESKANQNIATQSAIVAVKTAEIAVAAQRDSSSMKAIAALTMVFLPFTFIATLFAMPMFDWHAEQGQPVMSPRSQRYFGLYWAAATPLTFVVLCSWLFCSSSWFQSWFVKRPIPYE